jgi:hypothetical protein
VKEWLKLHNLHIDHVMIQSELKYLIGAKVAETRKWNRGMGSTQPKNHGFMSGTGINPAMTEWVLFLVGSGTEPNGTASQSTDRWRVMRTRC